jgi:hypothetical protein
LTRGSVGKLRKILMKAQEIQQAAAGREGWLGEDADQRVGAIAAMGFAEQNQSVGIAAEAGSQTGGLNERGQVKVFRDLPGLPERAGQRIRFGVATGFKQFTTGGGEVGRERGRHSGSFRESEERKKPFSDSREGLRTR